MSVSEDGLYGAGVKKKSMGEGGVCGAGEEEKMSEGGVYGVGVKKKSMGEGRVWGAGVEERRG
jgi:hypothetical protein